MNTEQTSKNIFMNITIIIVIKAATWDTFLGKTEISKNNYNENF